MARLPPQKVVQPKFDSQEQRERLIQLCGEVFREANGLPEYFSYRGIIQKFYFDLKKVCESTTNVSQIEEEMDMGDIDLMVENAFREIHIIRRFIANEGWKVDDHLADPDNMPPGFTPFERRIFYD